MSKSILNKTYAAMTQIAYKAADALDKFKTHLIKLPENFKVLAKSTDLDTTGEHNLRAVAFVDETAKKVVIACAGTDPASLDDIYDDIKLFKGQAPLKLKAIKSFIDQVTKKLGSEAASYSFDTTGHSLGAVVANLAALDLKGRGYNVESSVTFDNPGARPIYLNAIKANILSEISEAEMSSIKFIAYQAPPNSINTANEQIIGKVKLLIGASASPIATEKTTEIDEIPLSTQAYVQNLIGQVGKIAYDSLTSIDGRAVYNYLMSWCDADKIQARIEQLEELGTTIKEQVEKKLEKVSDIFKTFTKIKEASDSAYSGMEKVTKIASTLYANSDAIKETIESVILKQAASVGIKVKTESATTKVTEKVTSEVISETYKIIENNPELMTIATNTLADFIKKNGDLSLNQKTINKIIENSLETLISSGSLQSIISAIAVDQAKNLGLGVVEDTAADIVGHQTVDIAKSVYVLSASGASLANAASSISAITAGGAILPALPIIAGGMAGGYAIIKAAPVLYQQINDLYNESLRQYKLALEIDGHRLDNLVAVFENDDNAGFDVSLGYGATDRHLKAHAPSEETNPGFFTKLKEFTEKLKAEAELEKQAAEQAESAAAEKSLVTKIWVHSKNALQKVLKFIGIDNAQNHEIEFVSVDGTESVLISTADHLKSFLTHLKETVGDAIENALDADPEASFHAQTHLCSLETEVVGLSGSNLLHFNEENAVPHTAPAA